MCKYRTNKAWLRAEIQRSASDEPAVVTDGSTTGSQGYSRKRVSRDARVTLEYTLLRGVNDDAVAAAALVQFCRDIGVQWAHVNIM
jgi:adenine C2-methylase RlmN of 23S rRNA A2503 and tRNA A37